MVKVIIHTKGATLRDKVMNVTRKCMELSEMFPCFSWDFQYYKGRMSFTAAHWDGDEREEFQFPLHLVEVDTRYKYIMDQLNELKWSAIYWQKEEHE